MSQRRGFGKLRSLPSGRYQASYIGPDLRRHNAPTTFQTKLDAEGWLRDESRELRNPNGWGKRSNANPMRGRPVTRVWWHTRAR